jgi:hypothetical protein
VGDLPVARVKLIGLEPSVPEHWDNHIVAWSETIRGVFDACLQFNMAERTGEERWETPAGLPLGAEVNEQKIRGYRHHLLTRAAGECLFDRLLDPIIDRAPAAKLDGADRFESRRRWYVSVLESITHPLASLRDSLTPDAFRPPDGFGLVAGESFRRGGFTRLTWVDEGAGRRLQMTIQPAPDAAAARELAAHLLTLYRERLRQVPNLAFPSAIFLGTEDGARHLVVFANGVVRLRSVGDVPVVPGPLLSPVLQPVLLPPG